MKIKEKPITVIVPSYNNSLWYKKNLSSLFSQKYDNYKVIYIDDCSTDKTSDLVRSFVKECEQTARFTLITNQKRCWALENIYNAILSCDNDDIIVLCDGDDWLYHDKVFKQINEIYDDKNVWITLGNYIEYPEENKDDIKRFSAEEFPQEVIEWNAFRTGIYPWSLRTFYAWLFKKIQRDDLLYEDKFITINWDYAIIFPMLEMAGERHKIISDINYVYNRATPLNDSKVNPDLQNKMRNFIRGLSKYGRLINKNDTPMYD